MYDSFIFYGSYYEAIKCLPEKEKINVYEAIMDYALYEDEKELDGVTRAIFYLIKPQIDANNKRRENGRKGGLSNAEANCKQAESKPEANVNVNVNSNVNENVNDNGNVNSNVNVDESSGVTDATDTTFTTDVTVTTITTPTDKFYFTEKDILELEKLYPDVDILRDIEKIQKEIDNMPVCNLRGENLERFISRWFERTQNSGGNKRNKYKNKKQESGVDEKQSFFEMFYEKNVNKSMGLPNKDSS